MLKYIVGIFMLFGGVFYSATTIAQEKNWQNFDFIRQSNAWLYSNNASGLSFLPVANISIAEVYANKSNGGFINYYQSDNSYSIGALTESFYRLTDRTVLYGGISYSNFRGKHMGGSAFINPYNNPFDIVESVDSTAGTRNMEAYSLTGGVSVDLNKKITVGGKIDYHVANYAKFKDLRHTNKLLDMNVSAGLLYKINKYITAGANYSYHRTVEGTTFQMFGNTDRQYYSLISFGSFYGRLEPFSDNGYTGQDFSNPLFNKYHGGSLQVEILFTPALKFFNELTYAARDGYFGKKSPNTIVHSKHNSNIFEYNGQLSLQRKKSLHQLSVNFRNEKLENFENVYKYETSEAGGVTNIVYYDAIKMLDRKYTFSSVKYTGNLGVEGYNPQWVLNAWFNYWGKVQTTSVYPFFRKQTINKYDINLSADKNITAKNNMYSISLAATYGTGSGDKKNDGLYATPSESQKQPASLDNVLNKEYEYLTANRITARIGFKYSHLFPKGIQGYIKANYLHTQASNTDYLKNNFHSVSISVGCSF